MGRVVFDGSLTVEATRVDQSVAVSLAFERPLNRNTDVIGLLVTELVDLNANFGQVQARTFSSKCLGNVYTLFSYLSGLFQSSIWAMVWLVNDADITKLGWPVAQPG